MRIYFQIAAAVVAFALIVVFNQKRQKAKLPADYRHAQALQNLWLAVVIIIAVS